MLLEDVLTHHELTHGVVHIVEFLRHEAPRSRFLVDAPAVLGPPLVVITAFAVLGATRKPRPKRI